MPTVTMLPNSIDEVHHTLSSWFASGFPGKQTPCTLKRRTKDSGIDVFISHFVADLKVKCGERSLLLEAKTNTLDLNLERFQLWSAFESDRLCLKINEDPAANHWLLKSAFRQISETKHPAFCTRLLRAVVELQDDLSISHIEEAVAAPTDQLAMLEALSSADWVEQLAAEDPILNAKLRGLELRQEMLQRAGGVLTSEEVAAILGVSRQAVDKRRLGNQLLALTQGKRGYQYPGFQFEDGKVLPGLDGVLASLEDLDPWMQIKFFTSPHERLDNRTPIAVLQKGRIEEVVKVARGFGEQGAI